MKLHKLLIAIVILFLAYTPAFAQKQTTVTGGGGGGCTLTTYTVATLPASPTTCTEAVISDGDGYTCSTGGGSTRVNCYWNGSAWVTLGDGNSGSAPAFSAVTAGTSTEALVVGTGGSLSVAGSGTIAATTSAALAANGTNCSAGSYPLGVSAVGAAENCTDATTEIDSAIATHAAIADAHHTATVDTTLSEEEVEDFVGGMVTGGTETLISVTYTDGGVGAGVLNFVVDEASIDHGSIAGLTDDDHSQYALLAGRSSGQTIIGGTGAGDDLTLATTSNVSKGSYIFSELDCSGNANGGALTADASGVVTCSDDDGGSGVAFSAITGSTNTTAAMVVGTGASLAVTGSGTIAATTSAALAANGANCSAGSYALGVDDAGAAEGCTDATTEIDSAIATHAADASAHHAAGIANVDDDATPTFDTDLGITDGSGDTPDIKFTPQTGTVWDLFVEDTGDDFQVAVNTASDETFDFANAGVGNVDVTIDGDLTVGGSISTGGGSIGIVVFTEGASPGAGASAGEHNFYVDSVDGIWKAHVNGGSEEEFFGDFNQPALGTDTTGNYAGSGSEGGSATSAVQLDDGDYGDVSSSSGTVTVDAHIKSVWFGSSLSADGTNCADPTEVSLSGWGKQFAFVCTDNDGSTLTGSIQMPDGWNAGTVTFELAYVQTAADTSALASDISAQCVGAGETPAGFGTEIAIDDAAVTGSAAIDNTTSAAVTPAGTCAAGDYLQFQWQMDATGTTTAVGTLNILGIKMEYTTALSD